METKGNKYTDISHGGELETRLAWKKLRARLEADGLLEEGFRTGLRLDRSYLRIAAGIALILGVAIPTFLLRSQREDQNQPRIEQWAAEGVRTLDLPDGSRVFMNQGSRISYPEDFEEGRAVELDGEAYFEVMSDPVKPFSVSSGKVVVSVLGTSFNVNASSKPGEVEVFVESGKVRMELQDQDTYITLQPGQLGRTSMRELDTEVQEDPNYLSWKTKDFKFVDEELIMVLRELAESYHVDILVDPELVADKRISTSYREQSIDAILETIGTAFALNVNKKQDQYYLEP